MYSGEGGKKNCVTALGWRPKGRRARGSKGEGVKGRGGRRARGSKGEGKIEDDLEEDCRERTGQSRLDELEYGQNSGIKVILCSFLYL